MKTITIAGNCGKDAETRTTQSGQKVTSVSIGVSHYDGRERSTIWFDVSMWGKRGETLAQFARKGAKLAVSGDLSTREYNGKTYLQVNAQDFTPMGERQQTGHADPARQAPVQDDFDSDSIPF
ncbi:single-stranded DNA-binding protein [Ruegeria sp. HKCCD6109]|uniref:single-stranded DNA-binding protein n=1 Tax=Ruegeria sp. HKCCD6109 TaxID=2683017 RepID=UPI001491894A|nr:single-stranded DNA-binding protein [Ruegeria sp. HKCCD6109]NOD65779.1 single-stranded DNA-binding protein [Ruegeria sp. HKCCD6109]